MLNRRTLVTLAAAAMATVSSATFAAAQDKVVVGVVTVAPPFSYSEGGKITGISNDILQRVAELENFTIDYVPLKFDALIPSIQAGQIDIAVSGIFVTEERKKIVDFSDPYHIQGAVLVAPVDSSINGIEDLRGKTIASEQGSAALNIAKANEEKWGATIRILQDAANMQLAMRTGDVDAMIYDSGIVAYQMRVEGDKPTIKAISETIQPTGIAFAFPKGSKWIEVVNRGMATMEAAGEITAIKEKYDMN
jgi:ABC-type amino acid transport substrate-binding protein